MSHTHEPCFAIRVYSTWICNSRNLFFSPHNLQLWNQFECIAGLHRSYPFFFSMWAVCLGLMVKPAFGCERALFLCTIPLDCTNPLEVEGRCHVSLWSDRLHLLLCSFQKYSTETAPCVFVRGAGVNRERRLQWTASCATVALLSGAEAYWSHAKGTHSMSNSTYILFKNIVQRQLVPSIAIYCYICTFSL